MAAAGEHDSSTETLQAAAEEEEAKTFKDLVRMGDAGIYFCGAGVTLAQGLGTLYPGL